MGGLRRPLTPVEAAETPADLAKDFIFLLNRMRQLADTELAFNEQVSRSLWNPADPNHLAEPTPLSWE